MRVGLLNFTLPESNGSKVVMHLCVALKAHVHLDVFKNNFRALLKIKSFDLLIAHTPLYKAVPLLIVAKIFRKKTVGLVWDYYPVTISGRRYTSNVLVLVRDWLEHIGYSLVDEMLVPTRDFLSTPRFRAAVCLPYWVGPPMSDQKATSDRHERSVPIIAFAGQINPTRGLPSAIAEIDKRLHSPAILRIFSKDQLKYALPLQKLRIEYKGYFEGKELERELRTCDCGLVSLNPDFDGPGFPSKTFDYLGVGIPIIYSGPPLNDFVSTLERTQCGINILNIKHQDFNSWFSDSLDIEASRNAFFDKYCLDAEAVAVWLRERLKGDGV